MEILRLSRYDLESAWNLHSNIKRYKSSIDKSLKYKDMLVKHEDAGSYEVEILLLKAYIIMKNSCSTKEELFEAQTRYIAVMTQNPKDGYFIIGKWNY